MNKKTAFAALLALAVLAAPMKSGTPEESRVLVLGLTAPLFDDIQERYCREALIRQFSDSGFAVVPVMEMEALLQADPPPDLRRAGAQMMEGFCRDMKAGHAMQGSIVITEKEGGARSYTLEVTVYSRNDRTLHKTTVTGEAHADLHRFIHSLCPVAVDAFKKLSEKNH
jgi:hypothetical protein